MQLGEIQQQQQQRQTLSLQQTLIHYDYPKAYVGNVSILILKSQQVEFGSATTNQ